MTLLLLKKSQVVKTFQAMKPYLPIPVYAFVKEKKKKKKKNTCHAVVKGLNLINIKPYYLDYLLFVSWIKQFTNLGFY